MVRLLYHSTDWRKPCIQQNMAAKFPSVPARKGSLAVQIVARPLAGRGILTHV
jgi:hypothetical protein